MLYDFPRWVGNPYQSPVYSKEEFIRFVQDNNGINPCYTSHNSFIDFETMFHRYVPWDLDADEKKGFKLDDSLADALHWREWARNNKLKYLIVFTGGRGFHCYSIFKPMKVKNNQALKDAYTAFQMKAVRDAKLRTSDPKVIGDTRRILRIVNAKYVGKDGVCNGLHAVEVPDEVLDQGSLDAIIEYAKEPHKSLKPEGNETFLECMKRLDVRPEHKHSLYESAEMPFTPYRGQTPDMLKALIPRPCIHSGLMAPNPPHAVRLEGASTLVRLGYDLSYIQRFFHDLSNNAKWVDRHNMGVTDYQIYHMYRRGGYKPHACQTLRAQGVCIGPECPIFAKVWPDEARALKEQQENESVK